VDLLAHPDSHWFDLGNGEKREDVILLGLQATIDQLKTLFGADMEKWSWGRLHQCAFHHPLSANPVMAALFNRGPYPTGGDSTTVWATGGGYQKFPSSPAAEIPPESTHLIGPPYRMIVDLGDLRNSLSLLAPGQSGNPASPYYDNQVMAWYQAGYHPMLYERQDVEKHLRHKLILSP
jgi:penicillin amidase